MTGTEAAQQWQLMRAGWHQHAYGPPTGHPDIIAAWSGASALNRYVDLALYAHQDWLAVASVDRAAAAGETLGAYVAHWAQWFGLDGLPDVMAATGRDPATPIANFTAEEVAGWLANSAIAFWRDLGGLQ